MDLLKLLSRMDRDRFENIVVSMSDVGPIGETIQELGVPVHALGAKRNRLPLASLVELVRKLRRERPSILQTWMYHANFVGLGVGFIAGVPHTVWNLPCSDAIIHSDYGSRTTRWLARASAALSRWPDAVVTNSFAGVKFHESIAYHPRRWELIPNGFNLEQFKPDPQSRESVREELNIPTDALVIGLMGRYHPMKDHSTFLAAASILHRERAELHFVLVGKNVDGSNPELQSLIAGYDLASCIHLLGARTDTARLMASFDIATSSSAYGEGLSNVIPEAMACGVPCVVTDVGDAALVVDDERLVVPPRDPEALAASWGKLVEAGSDERRRFGAEARNRIENHYSIDKFVHGYEDLYASISPSPRRGGPPDNPAFAGEAVREPESGAASTSGR